MQMSIIYVYPLHVERLPCRDGACLLFSEVRNVLGKGHSGVSERPSSFQMHLKMLGVFLVMMDSYLCHRTLRSLMCSSAHNLLPWLQIKLKTKASPLSNFWAAFGPETIKLMWPYFFFLLDSYVIFFYLVCN